LSSLTDELIDGWEAAWSSRRPGDFAPLCAAAVHYEDPVCDAPLRGPGAIGAHAERLWRAFPDVRMTSTGPRLTDGRFVAAPVRITGTHSGDLEDLPASHRALVVQAVFFCELEAERLGRVRAFFDQVGAGRQLGLLPDRGGLGERALLVLRGFGLRLGRDG
jgi:steroid delta-isomerase-like uncharacterized protein